MSPTMIPDDDLIAVADKVTVWVATHNAPSDVWSLSEAIEWILSQPDRANITLFRPPAKGLGAAWVKWDQVSRIALALRDEATSSAA